MANKIYSQNLQSQVIDFLRFPLIVGVVFIHNTGATVTIPNATFGNETVLPLHYICSNLFSDVLGRIAVPLFFFMSGLLFFLNIEHFNGKSYGNKLRTRAKTLFVPYLFWNLAAIAVYSIIAVVPALKAFVNHDMAYYAQHVL